jgi:mono/diheme cytochrome c family protein
MKRFLPLVLTGVLALSLGLSGCDNAYSPLVHYGVRSDPLMVAAQPGQLGEDQYEPDRPGVFPIMNKADVTRPDNPLSAKGDKLFSDNSLRDPTVVSGPDRQKLDEALLALFGTPAEPKVAELTPEATQALGLDAESLKHGSRYYRIHCVHCHGVPGDGRGPTSRWISPHPRDFRQGLFKFMSVDQTRGSVDLPPRRDDILHTLRHGIEGTGMPSFVLLSAKDLNYLTSYVIHLSMRGKAEFDTLAKSFEWKSGGAAFAADEESPTIAEAVKGWHKVNIKKWVDSQETKNAIQIPAYNEHFPKKDSKDPDGGEWQVWKKYQDDEALKARIRGAIAIAMFNDTPPTLPEAKEILDMRGDKTAAVKCVQCHTDYGRQAKFKFDSWATLVRPNNFTNGVFRGGRRPVDIYHRIHSGINGSNMTPFGSANTMSSNSIWNMVELVQSLSYPTMRKKLGLEID